MSQDGIVTDPMLDCETVKYVLPDYRPNSPIVEAFWSLCPQDMADAGPAWQDAIDDGDGLLWFI